ncbi:MAG: hypothetical protein JWO36_5849 [Myxococcales bacterium]|nr:hypothetical protein [Myxococcales bacterium]
MQFCPWYPLGDAANRAPVGEGVLQVRLAGRLLDYPTGMSAMVHYEHAADVRASAMWLGQRFAGLGLLCRHLEVGEGEQVDFGAIHAKVLDEFVRRFGRPPAFPQ